MRRATIVGDVNEIDPLTQCLGQAACDVAAHSHSPYSGFKVGAAALAPDGSIFVGCNVENVSFPEGICAETAAIAALVAAGHREIVRIAIWSTGPDICTPCGGCRQRIAELGRTETVVDIFTDDRLALKTTLGELYPLRFGVASVATRQPASVAAPTTSKAKS